VQLLLQGVATRFSQQRGQKPPILLPTLQQGVMNIIAVRVRNIGTTIVIEPIQEKGLEDQSQR